MPLHFCVCDICWRFYTACALNFNVNGQEGTPRMPGWDSACCTEANTRDVKSTAWEVSRIDEAFKVYKTIEAEK